ncbi:MAG TPA: hypothetical protein VMT96_00750, partial [Candidatus Bathyarchaeia archaeon]|nr:hypothetical protein [Candidatus Bathyarchaeia archaeon]
TFTMSSGSVTQINGTTIDGVSPSIGDRILITTAPASTGAGTAYTLTTQPGNGIYVVTGNTTNLSLSRAPDMSGPYVPSGLSVFVEAGTIGAGSQYVVITPSSSASFTYGSGNIAWKKASGGPGGGVGKYTATIGDGSTTAIAVTHNLGAQDVVWSIRDASTNEFVDCDVVSTSTTQITFTFQTAPASNAYKVVIIG